MGDCYLNFFGQMLLSQSEPHAVNVYQFTAFIRCGPARSRVLPIKLAQRFKLQTKTPTLWPIARYYPDSSSSIEKTAEFCSLRDVKIIIFFHIKEGS